jgi:hypothetical protein
MSLLPGSLADTRDLALEGEVPEADPADAELAIESPRTAAESAPVDLPAGELRLLLGFED